MFEKRRSSLKHTWAPSARLRNRTLRSVESKLNAIEQLESRKLMTFLPVTTVFAATEAIPIAPGTLIATFQGNPGDTYTASIDWGDGHIDSGPPTVVAEGNPSFFDVKTGQGHTYAEETLNPLNLKIGVTDTSVNPNGNPPNSGIISLPTTVFDAPLTGTAIAISGVTEGVPFTNLPVATFTDPDTGLVGTSPNAPTDYTATITWADGQTSAGTISTGILTGSPAVAKYTVTGSHSFLDEIPASANKVTTVLITDTDGGLGGSRATATVTDSTVVLDAPLSLRQPVPISQQQPSPVTFLPFVEGGASSAVVATLFDSNNFATTADFTGTVTWGDGGSSPASFTVAPNDPSLPPGGTYFNVSGTHTYVEEGNETIQVNVTDVGGSVASFGTGLSTAPYNFNVKDAPFSATPTPLNAVEGATVSGVAATVVDSNPGAHTTDFSGTINWGDGTTPPTPIPSSAYSITGNTPSSTTLTLNVAGLHTYTEEGVFNAVITITDIGGAPAQTVTSVITVNDAPLAPRATQPVIAGFTEGIIPASSLALAAFTDADPNGAPGDYTATINWGDSTSTTISPAAATTTLSGPAPSSVTSPAITNGGSGYTSAPAVTFTGGGGSGAAATAVLTNGVVTSFTGFNGGSGYTSAPIVTIAPPTGISKDLVNGGFVVSGIHTYSEEGNFNGSVTVVDTDGPNGTTAVPRAGTAIPITVPVADAPLTKNGSTPTTITVVAGTPVPSTLLAIFNDTDPFELESGDNANNEYNVAINWGDGTPVDTSKSDHNVVQQSGGTIGKPPTAAPAFNVFGLNHTYSAGTASNTPLSATIAITDVGGAIVTTTLAVFVSQAPLVPTNPPAPQLTGFEGQSLNNVLATSFLDTNQQAPPNTPSNYLATINWGDSTTSAGTVASNGSGGYNVTGTHTYAEENTPATPSYTIKTLITEPNSASPSFTQTLTNSAVIADSPITVSGISFTPTEGILYNNQAVATFTDGDLVNTASADYAITINWGDGSSSAGTASFISAGKWQVLGTHTYAEEGVFNNNPITGLGGVQVTVVDTDGGPTAGRTSGSAFSTATVVDAPLTASPVGRAVDANGNPIVEGKLFTNTLVATFTDADTGASLAKETYSATIMWNDGSPNSQGTIASLGNVGPGGIQVFGVFGSHTFTEDGFTAIQVLISDDGGAATQTALPITSNIFLPPNNPLNPSYFIVQDAALTATPGTVNAIEGANFSGPIGTFTDADPNGHPGDYFVSVYWGDNTPTVSNPPGGGITITQLTVPGSGPQTFLINGNHVYSQFGPYTLFYAVTDVDSDLATPPVAVARSQVLAPVLVNVADAPLTDTTPVQSLASTEGISPAQAFPSLVTFKDANPLAVSGNFSATINWGDGSTTSAGTISGTNATGFTVSGTHSYLEEGSYTTSVTVTDIGGNGVGGTGSTFTDTNTSIIVADAALIAGTPATPPVAGFTEGAAPAAQVLVNFHDNDTNNPPSTDYVATIAWGDSTFSAGTVKALGASNYSVSGAHAYGEQGTFTATVTVTDTDGVSPPVGTRSFVNLTNTVTVVDAPLTSKTGTTIQAGLTSVLAQNSVEGATVPSPTVTLINAGTTATTLNGALIAAFQDADPGATTADYSVSVNWGDGSTDTIADATATTTLSGAAPSSVTLPAISGGGGGYTTVPAVTFTGGGGSGAAATAVLTNGVVTGFTGFNGGSGYTSPPTVAIAPPNPPNATTTPIFVLNLRTNNSAPATFGVVGTHVYKEEGAFTVTVTVTDNDLLQPVAPVSTSTFTESKVTFTVADAAISWPAAPSNQFASQEGSPTTNLPVGQFKDANTFATAADFTPLSVAGGNGGLVTINWGDGTSTTNTTGGGIVVTPAGGGFFNVTGTHTYLEDGVYNNVTVTALDDGGKTATSPAFTVTVPDAPLSNTNNPQTLSGKVGTPLTNVIIGTFGDADPNAVPGDFTASVNWGDGSIDNNQADFSFSPTFVGGGLSGFNLTGTHTYATSGVFTINATVTDTDEHIAPPGVTRSAVALSPSTANIAPGPIVTPASSPAATDAAAALTATDVALASTPSDFFFGRKKSSPFS